MHTEFNKVKKTFRCGSALLRCDGSENEEEYEPKGDRRTDLEKRKHLENSQADADHAVGVMD